eukprot:GEMP01032549.1.p1 GENE.GEMP01032549.1~~GEMP01032549.1.p1  ORF type:complete len:508 (+),score=65.07 GEMP01032549.1:405-1928(+)
MESGITVEFAILPKDSEIPPESVLAELVEQVNNVQSNLRRGKLGGFFAGATVKPIRGALGGTAAGIGPELSDLGEGSSGAGSPKRGGEPPDAEEASCSEMAEKCRSLQQRLKLKERELLDIGASQQERIKVLELLLKDREHLSQHAKDMWMKESGRATKLADALEEAETKTKDLENRLKELSEMYNGASQEVRQLKHWFSSQEGYVPSASVTATAGKRQADGQACQTSPTLGGFNQPASRSRPRLESPGDCLPGRSMSPTRPRNGIGSAAESNHDRFRHLCLVNDAILYEDDVMQIGIKSSYRDLEGEVFIFFGNKHTSVLQSLSVNLHSKNHEALNITWTTAPQLIEPKQQICQRLNVRSAAPFSEDPSMQVQFLLGDGTPRRIQTRLPITINKFLRPCETITASEYMTLWRKVEFVRNEFSAVVNLSKRFEGRLASLAKCVTLGGALRLLVGVDGNPDNFVLCGQWPGDFPYTLLMRVEIGTGSFKGKTRLAVRSDSSSLAQAVF